jgi:site-specific DNA recombinase
MLRAAIYSRYSSDLQRPASIEDQARRCRAAIEQRGWAVTHTLEDRETVGTVTRRPGYQALLELARTGQIDVIVVDELSRLTRDPEELASLRKHLRFWEVGLVALGDGLDTIASPASAAPIMLVRALVNEQELEQNAHRSRRGLEGRVLAGQHAGGAVYGYRTRPVHDDKPGDPPGTGQVLGYEYLIYEPEAVVVRRVHRLYSEGMSSRKIAALLNAEGVAPPGANWSNRTGLRKRTWSHSAIMGDIRIGTGLLNQCKYDGRLIYNRSTWPKDPDRDGRQVRRNLPTERWIHVEAERLRIVPHDLWNLVKARQQRQSRAGTRTRSSQRNRRLLSGVLVCAQCGGKYVLRGANTYACATRQDRGAVVCDCAVTVNAAVAEQAVLDELKCLFTTEAFLDRLVERVQQRWHEARSAHVGQVSALQGLQQQLAEVEDEIANLVRAVAKGVLVEALTDEMRTAEARRNRIRQEIATAQKVDLPAALTVLPETVRRIVSDLPAMLAAGQMEQVKSALTRLVGRIEVHGEERPGRKRPGAVLVLQGNAEGILRLADEKVKIGNSPGGIRTRDLMAENHAS